MTSLLLCRYLNLLVVVEFAKLAIASSEFSASALGDRLVIREQTLDQKSFIVTNLRTDTQGLVPSQLIKFGELNKFSWLRL